jgi:hypothetical protein
MTMRTFLDVDGLEWQVFDVIPRREERRHYDRRTPTSLESIEDRERREEDRRITVGATPHVGSKAAGWLCFERGSERRRLMPIPDGWTQCPDTQLDEYRRAAAHVDVLASLSQTRK